VTMQPERIQLTKATFPLLSFTVYAQQKLLRLW